MERYRQRFSLALVVTLAGCGEPRTSDCDPACDTGQTCRNGTCEPVGTDCIPACGQDEVCVDGTCAPVTTDCDPECDTWQVCSSGACFPGPGRCGADADCSGVCDLTGHVCVEATCESACAVWEICPEGECELAPGRCGDTNDCTDPTPVCDPTAHLCIPVFDQPVAVPPAVAVIITSAALRQPFERLAQVHTLTGLSTEVETVEAICDGSCTADPRSDAAAAIKAYLIANPELSYVVLGGDIEEVPSREVYDEYTYVLTGAAYAEYFYTDYYYADLSPWDNNGDGVYADDLNDAPDYLPELGVARIPVSSVAEVNRYIDKVIHHLTAYNLERIETAALLANVATTVPLFGFPIDIDGGVYFESDGRTVDAFPPSFDLVKLYALGTATAADATTLTVDDEITALEAGHNIIVHAGHGSPWDLTTELDGTGSVSPAMAYNLVNDDYPFFLSCACQAAAFEYDDAAAENFMNAPQGGAIGYMGNTAIGLGLGGGSQLIDDFLEAAFATPNCLVGDALVTAHTNFTHPDQFTVPVVQIPLNTVTLDSWEWTHKTAIFFGDPLLPIWTDPELVAAPAITVSKSSLATGSVITIAIAPAATGTIEVDTGAGVYRVDAVQATSVELTVAEDPSSVAVGFAAPGSLFGWAEADF